MTYTAQSCREEAAINDKFGDPIMNDPDLLRAHADLLDWKARIEAAQGEDVREPIEWHRRKAADFSIAKSPAWAEEHAKTATLLESLSAKLAEREVEVARLKAHAEAMAEHWEKDDTMNMMQSAVDAYRRDYPKEIDA